MLLLGYLNLYFLHIRPWLGISQIYGFCISCRFHSFTGITYRLFGGPDKSEGIVEISYDGQWGTICDFGWSAKGAAVACRGNGFIDGLAMSGAKYASSALKHFVSLIQCQGNENSLLMCPSAGFNSTNSISQAITQPLCSGRKHAAVKCYDKELGMNAVFDLII